MIIQNCDGSLIDELQFAQNQSADQSTYRVEVPVHLLDERSSLIERIIAFAFDTLGSAHVDVRVREEE